eukprot:CAMPEP_0194272482 /NCGR_PEP_ID=MMETSP0169-20130528/6050_1 /TAXON_ID=218684 /ORGANISM="Corethron pennatum, Strain L29A3" /LENGTH=254 /DNA_ID=CAMNT_0039015165 /DNA_START=205 /DNA_END=965 /DNA_ORIENTATION=-
MQRLLVLGGNGYVGQNICRAALDSGRYTVTSLSRSGPPSTPHPCLAADACYVLPRRREGLAGRVMDQIEWHRGDIYDFGARDAAFAGADVVISTLGVFGTHDASMGQFFGDATIAAVAAATEHGATQFGFVSSAHADAVADFSPYMPYLPLYAYFRGKAKAEEAVRHSFPEAHVIVRPSFVHGPRAVGPLTLPLQLAGAPFNFLSTECGRLSSAIQAVPFLGAGATSMVPVGCLGEAMIQTLLDKSGERGCTLS